MVRCNPRQARSVTLLVLLVLAVMWASVLLPPYVRSRHEGRLGTVGSYRQRLSVLDRRPPSPTHGTCASSPIRSGTSTRVGGPGRPLRWSVLVAVR